MDRLEQTLDDPDCIWCGRGTWVDCIESVASGHKRDRFCVYCSHDDCLSNGPERETPDKAIDAYLNPHPRKDQR